MPNELVEYFRRVNPSQLSPEDMGSWTDDDITRYYGLDLQPEGRDLLAEFPGFKADWDRIQTQDRKDAATLTGELAGGAKAAWEGAKGMAYGVVGLGAEKVGATGVRDWALEHAREKMAKEGEFQAAVPSIGDIGGVRDAALWAAQGFGQLAPSMAEMVGTAAAGAAVGSATAPGPGTGVGALAGILERRAIRELVKRGMERGFKKELVDEIGEYAVKRATLSEAAKDVLAKEMRAKLAMVGGTLGAVAASGQMNTGESFMNLVPMVDRGELTMNEAANIALVTGGVKAGADFILPARMIGKATERLFGTASKPATEATTRLYLDYLKRFAKEVAVDVPIEGSTEAFQQFADIAGERFAKNPNDPGWLFGPLTTEQWKSVREAGAVGSLGGVVGGVSQLVPSAKVEGRGRRAEGTEKTEGTKETKGPNPLAGEPAKTVEEKAKRNFEATAEGLRQVARDELAAPGSRQDELKTLSPTEAAQYVGILEEERAKQQAEILARQQAEESGKRARQAREVLDQEAVEKQRLAEQIQKGGVPRETQKAVQGEGEGQVGLIGPPPAPVLTSAPETVITPSAESWTAPETSLSDLQEAQRVAQIAEEQQRRMVAEIDRRRRGKEVSPADAMEVRAALDQATEETRRLAEEIKKRKEEYAIRKQETIPMGVRAPGTVGQGVGGQNRLLITAGTGVAERASEAAAQVGGEVSEIEALKVEKARLQSENEQRLREQEAKAKAVEAKKKKAAADRNLGYLKEEIAYLEERDAAANDEVKELLANFDEATRNLRVEEEATEEVEGEESPELVKARENRYKAKAALSKRIDEIVTTRETLEKKRGQQDNWETVQATGLTPFDFRPLEYREVADTEMFDLINQYYAATDEVGRNVAALALARQWTEGVAVKGKGAGAKTNNVVVWLAPDGRVFIGGVYERTANLEPVAKRGKTKGVSRSATAERLPKEGKTLDDVYRIATASVELTPGHKEGTAGIRELLDEGYQPTATMRLEAPAYQPYQEYASRKDYESVFEAMMRERAQSAWDRVAARNAERSAPTIDTVTGQVGEDATRTAVDTTTPDASEQAQDKDIERLSTEWYQKNGELVEKIKAFRLANPTISRAKLIAKYGEEMVRTFAGFTSDSVEMRQMADKISERIENENESETGGGPVNIGRTAGPPVTGTITGGPTGPGTGGGAGNLGGPTAGTKGTARTTGTEATVPGVGQPAVKAGGPAAGTVDLTGLPNYKLKAMEKVAGLYARGYGKITEEDVAIAREDIGNSDTDEQDVDLVVRTLEGLLKPRRMEMATPNEMERVDLSDRGDLAMKPAMQLPLTERAIRENLERHRKPRYLPNNPRGLLGEMDFDTLQRKYGTAREALMSILEYFVDPAKRPTRLQKYQAWLARAMVERVNDLGPIIHMLDVKEGTVAGEYNPRTHEIYLMVGNIQSMTQLHEVILHEVIHSFMSRLMIRANIDAKGLSDWESAFVSKAKRLVTIAKDAGVIWTDMDTEFSVDEFFAYSLVNPDFQAQLASIPVTPDLSLSGATNLWEAFKELVAKFVEGILNGWKQPATNEFNAAVASQELMGNLLAHYSSEYEARNALKFDRLLQQTERTTVKDIEKKIQQNEQRIADLEKQLAEMLGKREMRIRGLEGSLDPENVAGEARNDARVMMAVINALKRFEAAIGTGLQAMGMNLTTTGATLLNDTELARIMARRILGMYGNLDEKLAEIRRVYMRVNGGRDDVPVTTVMDDLAPAEKERTAVQVETILKRVEMEVRAMRSVVNEEFGKKNLMGRIAAAAGKVLDLTDKYKDATFIGNEYKEELRRALKETKDRGAISFAIELGIDRTLARDQVRRTMELMVANIDTYFDSLQTLAETNLDFSRLRLNGNLTPRMVKADIDGRISVRELDLLRDNPILLAVALQFARNRPEVMDFLSIRRNGDDQLMRRVREVVRLSTSDRADAFDLALGYLDRLKKLGGVEERIARQLKEMKEKHRKLLTAANRYAEFERIMLAGEPVLRDYQHQMERILQQEGNLGGMQYDVRHGEPYFAPIDANQSEEQVFVNTNGNPNRHVMEIGEHYDGAQARRDMDNIAAWLNAHNHLQGTANYNLLERTGKMLAQVTAEQVDYNLTRGINGVVHKALGSIPQTLDTIGLGATREMSRFFFRHDTLYSSAMRDTNTRYFLENGRLMKEAMTATKHIHSENFLEDIYDRAFGYLENHPEFIETGLTAEQQDNQDIARAMDYLMTTSALSQHPQARAAVEAYLRSSMKCSDVIVGPEGIAENMGHKIKDELINGVHIFRKPIGATGHAMSRGLRSDIARVIREGYGGQTTGWNHEYTVNGKAYTRLTKTACAELFLQDPAALRAELAHRFTPDFIREFVEKDVRKEGKSNYDGPTVNGVSDRLTRAQVMGAWTAGAGDIVNWIIEMHAAGGGTPETLADYIGETLYGIQQTVETMHQITQIDPKAYLMDEEVGRAFLDARQGENWTGEWLHYRTYMPEDHRRYVSILAQQAAFGDHFVNWKTALATAQEELKRRKGEYEASQELLKQAKEARRQGDMSAYQRLKAESEAKLKAGGFDRSRMNAAANLKTLDDLDRSFRNLLMEMNGLHTQGTCRLLVSLLAGRVIQGAKTALTDTVSIPDKSFRKWGFNSDAIKMMAGSAYYFMHEAMGSAFQALNMQLWMNAKERQELEWLNRMGQADPDVMGGRRGWYALKDRYASELADADGFLAIWDKGWQGGRMIPELARGFLTRVKAGFTAMDIGLGRSRTPETAFVGFKWFAPYTFSTLLGRRANSRMWYRMVNGAIERTAEYLRAHPAEISNPDFKVTNAILGYARRNFLLMAMDDKQAQELSVTLGQRGIRIEEAARRMLRGEPTLTRDQELAIGELAQGVILMDASLATRPRWSMNNAFGRAMAPLVTWSLSKTLDVSRSMRDPKGRAGWKAFSQALTAMAFGVLPTALVYAWLLDEYDQKLIGKKANLLPLTADGNLPLALLNHLNRVGTFGVAGDVVDSLFNQSTAREFSVDSRVLFASSLKSLMNVGTELYQSGGVMTYANAYRPLIQSMGGAGYLQNFDVVNNLAGFDNAERRIVRRIHVNNELRAIGRVLGYDVRATQRGTSGQTSGSPVKPYVGQMMLAAIANDAETFREAYANALKASVRANQDALVPVDPYQDVAQRYAGMNPLRSVFGKQPTEPEYQLMIKELGVAGADVAQAIRNFNAYAVQLPRVYGGPGLSPYFGVKERRVSGARMAGPASRSWQSITVAPIRPVRVADYRDLTVRG